MNCNRDDGTLCLVLFFFILPFALTQMEVTLWHLRVPPWIEKALFKLTEGGILVLYGFNQQTSQGVSCCPFNFIFQQNAKQGLKNSRSLKLWGYILGIHSLPKSHYPMEKA